MPYQGYHPMDAIPNTTPLTPFGTPPYGLYGYTGG